MDRTNDTATLRRYQAMVDARKGYLAVFPQVLREEIRLGRKVSFDDLVFFALASYRNAETGRTFVDIRTLKAVLASGADSIYAAINSLVERRFVEIKKVRSPAGAVACSYLLGVSRGPRDLRFDSAFLPSGYWQALPTAARYLWAVLACCSVHPSGAARLDVGPCAAYSFEDGFSDCLRAELQGCIEAQDVGWISPRFLNTEELCQRSGLPPRSLKMAVNALADHGCIHAAEKILDPDLCDPEGWFLMSRPQPPQDPKTRASWLGRIEGFHRRLDGIDEEYLAFRGALKSSAPVVAPRRKKQA